jgi:hypothetical protein
MFLKMSGNVPTVWGVAAKGDVPAELKWIELRLQSWGW